MLSKESFIFIEYNGVQYPEGYPAHIHEVAGHLDKGTIETAERYSLHTEYYYMHPRSYNRRAVFSIHEPSATIRGVNRPIPDGYKRHHADKADISDGVRALTSKERSYIQTFPESFVFEGKKTDVEQAIGNAVPVKLAEYVAKCILDYELKEGAPSI